MVITHIGVGHRVVLRPMWWRHAYMCKAPNIGFWNSGIGYGFIDLRGMEL